MSEPASAVPTVDRPRLIRLAYRLLGSVEDAEDVVQDAHLRLLAGGHTPDDPGAYLFRTVTHLAIDRLRRLKVQRRAYAGPWLPEPLDTADEDASVPAERRQDLGIGLLLLLERLSVGERVAYVLREAFDLDFRTMSEVLDVRVEACRQRYHRARRKIAGIEAWPTPTAAQRRLLERLAEAVLAGDRTRLTALLAEDAVMLTDGGGQVRAAIIPVERPDRIAQVLLHIVSRQDPATFTFEWRHLNGGAGLLIRQRGVPFSCVQVAGEGGGDGRAARIYVMRNPAKLARL